MLRCIVKPEGKVAGLLQRGYHSKQGVWGYRPVAKRVFEGRKSGTRTIVCINHTIYNYVPERGVNRA